jgi:hypothetical protein
MNEEQTGNVFGHTTIKFNPGMFCIDFVEIIFQQGLHW